MTHNEFHQFLDGIKMLSPKQMQQLRRELDGQVAAAHHQDEPDPLLGSMSDHADLMDEIVEQAMRHREQQPWRISAGE